MAFVSDKLRRYISRTRRRTVSRVVLQQDTDKRYVYRKSKVGRLYRADLPHVEKRISATSHGYAFVSDSQLNPRTCNKPGIIQSRQLVLSTQGSAIFILPPSGEI